MDFDFDTEVIRRGSDCMKWDECPEDVIPLWVADMDFKAAPAILRALQKRAEHGVFGYEHIPARYYDSITRWLLKRDNFELCKSWILSVPAVIPGLSAILQALTLPGDQAIIQTPCYNNFFSSIRNSGLETVENPLLYKENQYFIDFEDLEKKLSHPRAKVLILCNPHNPTGRLWSRDELEKIGNLCIEHDILVISDEIHCDVRPYGSKFIPFGSLGKEYLNASVTIRSASKAFNLAGLQNAYIICSDKKRLERIDRQININEICDLNPFGIEATIAAYDESEDWLNAVNIYIQDNYKLLKKHFSEKHPNIKILPLESTYLAWLDCKATGLSSDELAQRLLENAKVRVNSGTLYGEKTGEGFLRINLACSRITLQTALERIDSVLTA